MNTPFEIEKLKSFFLNLPEGTLSPEHLNSVIEKLKDCWHMFDGSEEHRTYSSKLSRAENLRWQKPCLLFELERHGATVNGSTRADLHTWKVDLDNCRAHIVKNGKRQLMPMDKRMNFKQIAQEVSEVILSYQNHRYLNWSPDKNKVTLRIGEIVPETYKQTTSSRRKKFKQALDEIMLQNGWIRHDSGNKIGYSKTDLTLEQNILCTID